MRQLGLLRQFLYGLWVRENGSSRRGSHRRLLSLASAVPLYGIPTEWFALGHPPVYLLYKSTDESEGLFRMTEASRTSPLDGSMGICEGYTMAPIRCAVHTPNERGGATEGGK